MAALPLAATAGPPLTELAAAGLGLAAAVALSKSGEPSEKDVRGSRSTTVIDASESALRSPDLDSACLSPGLAPEPSSRGESSPDRAMRDAAKLSSAASATMPDFSDLRPQATRDPPVRVRYDGGSKVRIQLPFPYNIAVAAGYLLYKAFTSSDSRTSAARESTRENGFAPTASSTSETDSGAADMPPSDDEADNESGGSTTSREHKSEEYRKPESKAIKELLDTEGKDIYETLKKKAKAEFTPGSSRTLWENKDFRIDAGHLDSKKGVRHWEFQVNGDASKAAKRLLKGSKGYHQKLFKDTFEVDNPPEFEKWKKRVLGRLE